MTYVATISRKRFIGGGTDTLTGIAAVDEQAAFMFASYPACAKIQVWRDDSKAFSPRLSYELLAMKSEATSVWHAVSQADALAKATVQA